jgi:hypothetical protein
MLKASKDLFADKDNKLVPQQSTVSGTFKVAAEGASLSEEDAARYGITPDKYAEHGLEVIQQQAPTSSGLAVNIPQPSQNVTMGAPTQPQQQQSAQASTNAPAPAAATQQPAASTTTAPKPAATAPKAHTTATAKPAATSQPSPASSPAVSGTTPTAPATEDKK